MVASGRVNVKPLITHTYKLEEALQAFQRAKSGEGGAIKVRGAGMWGHRYISLYSWTPEMKS